MFIVNGIDPRGDADPMPGEFKDAAEALAHSLAAVDGALERLGDSAERVSGHNWVGWRLKRTGLVWKFVIVEIPDNPESTD